VLRYQEKMKVIQEAETLLARNLEASSVKDKKGWDYYSFGTN
jgi:hypothetical protein